MSSFVWEYIYVHIDSDKNVKHYVVLGTCDNITKRFGRWDRNWQDVIDKVPLLSTSLVSREQLSQKWEKNTRYDIISDQPWKPKWLFPPGAFSSSFPWSRTLPLNKVNSFQWWKKCCWWWDVKIRNMSFLCLLQHSISRCRSFHTNTKTIDKTFSFLDK